MKPSRRQFLQGSSALLGASSLLASAREPQPAEKPKGVVKTTPTPSASNPSLRMSAPYMRAQGVWILMEREAGFQMQLAGRELARGLRNLGLAREPIVAPKAGTEPATSDTVFTLAVNQGAFQYPEAYKISRKHGICEQTYYRWQAKYGGLEVSEARRLRSLEEENRRLKQLVAEQALDIQPEFVS